MGIMSKTWAELMLEAVGEVALREPMLRRSLPPGFARADFDRDTVRDPVCPDMAARVGAGLRLDPAMDLFADTFVRTRGGDTRGGILDAGTPVADETRLIRRPFAPWRIEADDQGILVVTAGGGRRFDASLHAAATRALTGQPFAVADLPGEDRAAVIAMAAELVAYGLLETE
jgi:bifunctional lysine-specific demethylase and histidyl-hydroxylase NO66